MIPPRREFLKSTAAAAAAMMTISPGLHAVIPDDQPINIGLIGCGGRGTGAPSPMLFPACGGPGNYFLAAGDDLDLGGV